MRLKALERFASRWWYVPLVAFLAAADAYIFFVPNEALLIPAVLGKPRRWLWISFWVTLGSAVGAVSLAYLVSRYGESVVHALWPKAIDSKEWRDSVRIIQRHGPWGLGLISFSPFPQHLAVVVAGLAHMRMSVIFIAVFVGRFVKYALVAWGSVHAPRLLRYLGVRI